MIGYYDKIMITTNSLTVQTKGHGDTINIAPQMFDILVGSRIRKGVMTVFVTGSTAGITTIEFEPNLVSDFKEMWQKLVPEGVPYHHDNTWGDANGYAHVRASRIGASLAVPFNNGELTLDTWQQVVLVDFDDKPRTRNIVALIMGE